MTLPLWGQLQKAQDDTETIEEAIIRLIAVHETSPTSHLGDGESLSSHKQEEIIDHPQGSILADKFTNKEFVLQPLFEATGEYTVSAYQIYYDLGGFLMKTSAVVNNVARLSASGQYTPNYFNSDRATIFQFIGYVSPTENTLAYVCVGGEGVANEPPGFGFKFEDGNLYAVQWTWEDAGFVEYVQQITGISLSVKHLYRVQVVPEDSKAYYWVDGVAVAELAIVASSDVGLQIFSTYVKTKQATQATLKVGGIYIGIQP